MDRKRKKFLSIFFKAAILILAFGFIYQKLSDNQNIANFRSLSNSLSVQSVWLILSAIVFLMFLNWFLESLKWHYLVRRIEKISIWKAVESVFCGLTWAVFTPNRIGEYGGRIFFLSPRKRIMGAIAMGVGAIGQMVLTNVLGALAMLWFVGRFLTPEPLLFFLLLFVVLIFCVAFLLFYFNIRWVQYLVSRVKFMNPFQKFFRILSRYKQKELRRVFLYCIARFVVFTTQYCLIIHLLVPQIELFDTVMMTFILFFVQSALPSLDLLDIGIRSMTATFFFGFITNQDIAIMAATACIWLVNLIIPAILGSVFVLKLNFFGNNHT